MIIDAELEISEQVIEADFSVTIESGSGSGDSGDYDEGYADGYEEGKTDTEVRAIALVNEGLTLSDLAVAEVNSLEEIPEKVDEAYLYGTEEGYESGKKAQYDAFWDAYLDNGNLRYTLSIFSGRGWNDITFKPKHSLHNAADAYMMFRQSQITDIGKSLKECGVTFTLTGNILQYTFNGMASKTLDNIVFAEPITTMYTAFGSATNLESIECPIPVQDANISGDSFAWCTALKEIRFNGTIASNLSFPNSANLSTDSIDSIIGALKDRTGTTAFTLTFHKTVGAKLTQAQKDAISAKNWTLVY